MTAIAGIVDRSDTDPDGVLTMLDAMGPRGPVERCGSVSGPARLGAGHLPGRPADGFARFTSTDSAGLDWIICSDSRLDDPDRLRQRLGGAPRSQAALILDAYRRWGEAAPEHLDGDFAFAIWDPVAHRLFFARDRFGVKPLFYSQQPGRFAFASEAKGILALSATPRRVPRVRIVEFLSGHSPPEDETFFADIRRLPAGSCGVAGEGIFRVRRYFRLTLPDRSTDADPAATFRALFEDAVRRRLEPGVPIVSTLSGGLDSSSVTAVARAALPDAAPLRTLSMVFPGRPEGDEQPFIDALLAEGNYAPDFVKIGAFDPFAGFQDSLRVQDSLVLAPALTLNRDVYKAVPAGGVMLSGDGGDEVVSKGLGHLNDLARARNWKRLWIACGGAADIYGTSQRDLFWALFQRFGPGRYKIRSIRRALARALPAASSGEGILAHGLGQRYQEEFRRRSPSHGAGRSGRALDLDTVSDPLQVHALEIMDRESADAGMETRYPFWDERLVRFSLSLDPSTKLKDGWTRMILREAMADRLPDKIRWRRDKHDFSPVIVRGMITSPAASRDRLQALKTRLSEYIDLDRVEAARSRLETGPVGNMGADAQALWRATALAEWLDYSTAQGFILL